MPIGDNTPTRDKLIKNTTVKEKHENKARKTSNTNITSIIGGPSPNPETATYETKKMTFYVKSDLLQKLYNFAYWDRHSVTEAFNLALTDGLKGKTTKNKESK